MAITAENKLHLAAMRSQLSMGIVTEEEYNRAVQICEEEGGA